MAVVAINAFLSATFKDLQDERSHALGALDYVAHAVAMERFGAMPYPSLDVCLGELSNCDVVVLILGSQYGTQVPTTGNSYTEEEFNRATGLGLPVLSFLKTSGGVWENKEVDASRKAKLEAFRQKVENVTVPARFERPEDLPLAIQRAWSAVIAREGHLDVRGRSFVKTASFFKGLLEGHDTFNHSRELVGRQSILGRLIAAAIDPTFALITVNGAGGAGKTRLLLELAREVEGKGIAVRWVRDGSTITADSIRELPTGRVVLFCDDAHRRADLQQLMVLTRARNDIAIVAGLRTWGKDAVMSAATMAGVRFAGILDVGALDDLTQDDLVALVAPELGAYQHLADRLVAITKDSPLVALVAARLLASREVHPDLLARDTEFRHYVLQRFRDERIGRIADMVEPLAIQRTLALVSAIQYINRRDDGEIDRGAQLVGLNGADFRGLLGTLEAADVLRNDSERLRIVPDVLSDWILDQTVLDQTLRPTGFEQQVLDQMGPRVLSRVMQSCAELDWRTRTAGAQQGHAVFEGVWQRVTERFWGSGIEEQERLLKAMTRIAPIRPSEILAQCEEVVSRASEDESLTPLLSLLPPVIAGTSFDESIYQRALDLLWALGRVDTRETNQYPEHAMRVLAEVVGYHPGRGVWRQTGAAEALRRWVQDGIWSERAHSPLAIAEAVLMTAVLKQDWRGDALVLTRIPIRPDVTAGARLDAISLLGDLVLRAAPRGRILALDCLLHKALARADRMLGHAATDEEEDGWNPQHAAALDQLERVARESADPIVLMKLCDGMHWAARIARSHDVKRRAVLIRRRLHRNPELRFARVISNSFREPLGRLSWQAAQREGGILITKEARRLANAGQSPAEVQDVIDASVNAFEAARVGHEAGRLIETIARENPALAIGIANVILADPRNRVRWLPFLINPLRGTRPAEYERLMDQLVETPEFRVAAARALYLIGFEFDWSPREIAIATRLVGDASDEVRATIVSALTGKGLSPDTLRSVPIEQAIRGSADVAGSLSLLAASESGRIVLHDESTAKTVLKELTPLPNLDSHNGRHFDPLMERLAQLAPLSFVEFLRDRADREAKSWETNNNADGYDAVPYHPWHGVPDAIRQSEDYETLVPTALRILGSKSEGIPMHSLHKAIRSIIQWDAQTEAACRAWAQEGCSAIEELCSCLSSFPGSLVLRSAKLVEVILDSAAACPHEVREKVNESLADAALGLGQVHEIGDGRLQQLRTQALETAESLADGAARTFYQSLVRKVDEEIQQEERMMAARPRRG